MIKAKCNKMVRINMNSIQSDVAGIFNAALGIIGRPFGASNREYEGVSDNAKGVQWNIATNKKNQMVRLGVNLEGMKYNNWPIATFIENEKEKLLLPVTKVSAEDAKTIIVGFYRDAWQRASKPRIQEDRIGDGEISLSELTKEIWSATLVEAYECLDKKKDHRGRATQLVTKSTGKVEMEVSPHLNIHTYIGNNKLSMKDNMIEAFDRLRPIYDFVKEASGDTL